MSFSFSGQTDQHHVATVGPHIVRAIWTPAVCDRGQRVQVMVWTEEVPDGHVLQLTVSKFGPDTEFFVPRGFPATVTIQKGYGCASWKVDYDDPASDRYNHIELRFLASSATLTGVSRTSENHLRVGSPYCRVQGLDAQFAPHVEQTRVAYRIFDPRALIKSAVVRVYGNRYNNAQYPAVGALVYEQRLNASQFRHGEHGFAWRGECTTRVGTLAGQANEGPRAVNPLFSPYIVELEFSRTEVAPAAAWPTAGTIRSFTAPENFTGAKLARAGDHVEVMTADAPPQLGGFEVTYAELKLGPGDHLYDGVVPTRAQKSRWALYLLNWLGFHGGPIDGAITDDDAKIALRRFQHRSLKTAPAGTMLPWTGTLDADTEAALASSIAPRFYFERDRTPFEDDLKLYFDDNFGYGDHPNRTADFKYAAWNNDDRMGDVEEKFFNRGWIPVEARVHVRGRNANPVFSPKAVGGVKVCFEFEEPATEDATRILPANATAERYVRNARTFQGGLVNSFATAGAAPHNQSGTNAPGPAHGFRDLDPAQYVRQVFEGGTRLRPFFVDFGSRTEAGRTIHFASTFAATAEQHRPWMGRGGVYWRPSHKAGDGYILKARLDFSEHPNHDLLEPRYANRPALAPRSAEFRVWRRSRICAFIYQNPRTGGIAEDWATVAREFAQAYIEIENSGLPYVRNTYATYVPEADYKRIAAAATGNPAASLTYNPDILYGLPIRAQNAGETWQHYIADLETLIKAFCQEQLIGPLSDFVRRKVRASFPEGYVLMDVRYHRPLNVKNADGTPAGFIQHVGAAALGRSDFQVWFLDWHPSPPRNLFPHEMGHCRFLQHCRTAAPPAAMDAPDSHDHDQVFNCTMSYSVASGVTDAAFVSHFCGKCLLRMRGWREKQLPRRYA